MQTLSVLKYEINFNEALLLHTDYSNWALSVKNRKDPRQVTNKSANNSRRPIVFSLNAIIKRDKRNGKWRNVIRCDLIGPA